MTRQKTVNNIQWIHFSLDMVNVFGNSLFFFISFSVDDETDQSPAFDSKIVKIQMSASGEEWYCKWINCVEEEQIGYPMSINQIWTWCFLRHFKIRSATK